jgi:hypothetical protein
MLYSAFLVSRSKVSQRPSSLKPFAPVAKRRDIRFRRRDDQISPTTSEFGSADQRRIKPTRSNPFANAQQQPSRKIPHIGWLLPTAQTEQDNLEEYRRGMLELGYVEGRTVVTKYLYSGGNPDRLDDLAATLVAEKVDVIVTFSTPGCHAAKRASLPAVIPLVQALSPVWVTPAETLPDYP